MNEWKNKNYSFVQNRACEFFPCHEGLREEDFNCLFCWCPLYALGESCGGACKFLEDGTKDCSDCLVPHRRENYGYFLERFGELRPLAAKKSPPKT